MTDTFAYDVFGAVTTRTGTTLNVWKFTGEQADDGTGDSGYYYLRARHYDPTVGRFVGRDKLEFSQRYTYVDSNPIRFTDPSGLCKFGLPCPAPARWLGDRFSLVANTYNNGYIEANITRCGIAFAFCVTGGVQFGAGQGIHGFLGGGIGTPGTAASVTLFPRQQISNGLSCGVQVNVGGVSAEAGFSGIHLSDYESGGTGETQVKASPFGGAGFYVGQAGVTGLCSIVFNFP